MIDSIQLLIHHSPLTQHRHGRPITPTRNIMSDHHGGAFALLLHLSLVAAASSLVLALRQKKRQVQRKRQQPTQQDHHDDEPPPPTTPQHARKPSSSSTANNTPVAQTPPTPFVPRTHPQHRKPSLSASALRVSRSLSEGPQRDVQERVSHALGMCPGMEAVGTRRIELLVHNISHKDMVLSLANPASPSPSPSPPRVADDLGGAAPTNHKSHRRRTSSGTVQEDLVLCRPKFSLFQPVSETILTAIRSQHNVCPSAQFPVYVRERDSGVDAPSSSASSSSAAHPSSSPHHHSPSQRERAYTLRRQPASAQPELSVGFDLSQSPLPLEDLANFRVRRDDAQKLRPPSRENGQGGGGPTLVGIDGVYFPLMASIVPKWRKAILEGTGPGGDAEVFKLVFLVSGVGMPRDQTSSTTGNSTEGTAELIEAWLRQEYPDVAVVRVHSTTNIFRYDENIGFVKNELLPLVEHYRDKTAERWGTEWRHKYHITISFADGSPARISAINAALRPYRPSFMHMWELKTFWHHAKMCLEDVELHSFEDIDTAPPVPLSHADARAQLVAQEMLRFKEEVVANYRQGLCGDLSTFWLRKTKKPVLAVLLVQKEGQPPILYRGCNMEVSMPTGSLCAERNAIGTALAADLTLKRRELKLVAVLSLSFHHQNGGGGGNGVKGGKKRGVPKALDMAFAAAAESAGAGGSSLRTPVNKTQPAPPRKPSGNGGEDEAEMEGSPSPPSYTRDLGQEGFGASPPRVTIIRSYSVKELTSVAGAAAVAAEVGGPTVAERQRRAHASSMDAADPSASIVAYSSLHSQPHQEGQGGELPPSGTGTGTTLTISVDPEDLNPLKPCGACMEWLKKIAEKNPEFRVATFTDEACRGIYTEFISTTS